MFKQCIKCSEWKSVTDFYKRSESKDGVKNICKCCLTDQVISYSRNRYSTIIGRASQLFQSAKIRARKKNIPFTICFDQVHLLLLLGICQKTGLKFDLSVPQKSLQNPFAPSLDRTQVSRGYEPDNIQLVCNMFNMGKSDHNEIDFIAMCMAVAEKNATNLEAVERLNELRNAGL